MVNQDSDLITPKSELDKRISKLQQRMQSEEVDCVLVLQQADKFYFSGTVQDGVIFIPSEGQPIFLVRKSFDRAKEESKLENIELFRSYKQIPEIVFKHGISGYKKIGLELDVMPVGIFRKLQNVFSEAEIVDASKYIKDLRMVKSEYELKQMIWAGKILGKAMEAVPQLIREGMTEIELAAETEIILRKSGHQGIIRMRKWNQECFYGLILSGESGAISNYMDAPLGGSGPNPAAPRGASQKKIKAGEPVIIDMVSAYNGYVVDCTRTFCIGKLESKLKQAFDLSLTIQEAVVSQYKKGANLRNIYEMAIDMAQKAGFGDYFMGYGNSKVKFLGHGVGLELDELPVCAQGFEYILEENITLALEPKFLFPKIGAVGVENTWSSKEGMPDKISDIDDNLMQ
jgi:Xaa-Pro dipeptidase